MTLSAMIGVPSVQVWPAVQVVFVLETTPYDGVFDPASPGGEVGFDPCAAPSFSGRALCEESNGVPFFVARAGNVAAHIQQANPNTKVTFGLVDFASASGGPWDDGDGTTYHADVGNFVGADQFGPLVASTFQTSQLGGGFIYPDSDLRDNFLHSSSITALYGSLVGSGLSWTNDSHHVVVVIGSTAPRDPSYVENYCVSPHASSTNFTGSDCLSGTCEPAFSFGGATSPECLGWVRSQDGVSSHSIAALASTAPACAGSLGGRCTVDIVDLPSTPTDRNSAAWPDRTSSIPGDRQIVATNVAHILLAGCDLASATLGSWDGPVGDSCPDGTSGTLPFPTSFGNSTHPNLQSPGLMASLTRISFGPPTLGGSVFGGRGPMFTFLPLGGLTVPANAEATAACQHDGAATASCQTSPTPLAWAGKTGLGWNWSTIPSQNVLTSGDTWKASFNLIASGSPYGLQPVDACLGPVCGAGGSGALGGYYSWAQFSSIPGGLLTTESFPLAQLRVELTPASTPPSTPPSYVTGNPPPSSVPAPLAFPGSQTTGSGPSISVANISIQALAAGAIAAGFTRVAVRNRSVAMRIPARAGPSGARLPIDRPRSPWSPSSPK